MVYTRHILALSLALSHQVPHVRVLKTFLSQSCVVLSELDKGSGSLQFTVCLACLIWSLLYYRTIVLIFPVSTFVLCSPGISKQMLFREDLNWNLKPCYKILGERLNFASIVLPVWTSEKQLRDFAMHLSRWFNKPQADVKVLDGSHSYRLLNFPWCLLCLSCKDFVQITPASISFDVR